MRAAGGEPQEKRFLKTRSLALFHREDQRADETFTQNRRNAPTSQVELFYSTFTSGGFKKTKDTEQASTTPDPETATWAEPTHVALD